MRYFNNTLDLTLFDNILEILQPQISINKLNQLYYCTNIHQYTSAFIKCFKFLLPHNFIKVLSSVDKEDEFIGDLGLHLQINTCSYEKIKFDQNSCVRTHQATHKTKSMLNNFYESNSSIHSDYYYDSTSNYNKTLSAIANQLNLELGNERGYRVKIPKSISPYVTHQVLNYNIRKSILFNQISWDTFHKQNISTHFLFRLLDETCNTSDEHLLNLYLLKREFKTDLIYYIINADYSSFIDKHSAKRLIALGSLLPNVFSSTKWLDYFLTYKELFSDPYYNESIGPIGKIFRTMREKEAYWSDNVQNIIIELAYFTFPLFEFLHYHLLSTSKDAQNLLLDVQFEQIHISTVQQCIQYITKDLSDIASNEKHDNNKAKISLYSTVNDWIRSLDSDLYNNRYPYPNIRNWYEDYKRMFNNNEIAATSQRRVHEIYNVIKHRDSYINKVSEAYLERYIL